MKLIVTEEVVLTMTRAQAQVMIDAMDVACDAHVNRVREIRATQRALNAKMIDSLEVFEERIGFDALTQVAIGCELIAEWDEEGDQPTALTDEQRDGLVAMIDALKKGGAL